MSASWIKLLLSAPAEDRRPNDTSKMIEDCSMRESACLIVLNQELMLWQYPVEARFANVTY